MCARASLLLQLDDADIRTQAARAQAQIKAAQAEQSALKTGGTQEEVLTLNSQLSKARSARDLAQRNLDAFRRSSNRARHPLERFGRLKTTCNERRPT